MRQAAPQFVDQKLLKSAIKTAKVCSLLSNPFRVLKNAVKTAEVWQFVYVATKLAFRG